MDFFKQWCKLNESCSSAYFEKISFIEADASIVLVGGNQGLTEVEVLSFDGSAPTSGLPDFPHPVSQAVGAFFNNEIFVCAGFDYPVTYYKECFAIRTGGDQWEERPSLNHYRKGKTVHLISVVINLNKRHFMQLMFHKKDHFCTKLRLLYYSKAAVFVF